MATKKKVEVDVDVQVELEPSLKQLRELKKQLKETAAGSEDFKRLTAQIDDMEDSLKGAKQGATDWIDSLENAGGPLGMVGRGINQMKVAFTSFNTALKASIIGLIVAALGGLVAAFSQNENAMKKLQPIFIQLQRILGGIFRALEPVLDAFVEFASAVLPYVTKGIGIFYSALVGLFTYIKEAGTGVFKFWKGLLTLDFTTVGEGVNQIAGSFQKTAEAYGASMKRFEAGTKEQTKIEKEQSAERQKNAEDAAKKAEELRKQQLEKQKSDLDAKIKLETDKENTSRDNLKKLLDQRMNLELQNKELTEAEKEVIRQEYAKKLEDALNADAEKEKKKREADLDAKIQLEIDKENTRREELKVLLDARMQEELSNTELTEAQKEVIRAKYAKQLEDALKADAEKRKKDRLDELQKGLDDAKGNYEESLKAYQALQQELTNSTEYSEQERVQLRKSYSDQILAIIDNQFAAETLKIENKYGEFARFDAAFYEEQRNALQNQNEQLKTLRANNAISEDEFNKRSAANSKAKRELDKLEVKSQQDKVGLISDALGNLSNIVGKDTVAGKAFAVAKATIDTYQSAVSAYKSLVGIPVIGPTLATIAAAAAIASGIATVKKIVAVQVPGGPGGASGSIPTTPGNTQTSPPPIQVNAVAPTKKAAGGLVRGPGTSTSDSIPALLSDGEFVVNARSTQLFRPLLSAINATAGMPQFAVGGLVNGRMKKDPDNSERIAQAVEQAFGTTPIRTYVTAADISNQQQFDRVIKSRSLI
jgi:DNA repair exonuclease SbcCD ATPase subunit